MKRRTLIKGNKKWCPHCKDWLPFDEFYGKSDSPGGRDCYCKKHRQLYEKKYDRRSYTRKHRYGVTKEQYDIIFSLQDGKCAICEKKKDHKLVVDHCHETGKFRGLICNGCNVMLGISNDNKTVLEKAIAYLTENSNGNPAYYNNIINTPAAPKPLPLSNTSGIIGVSWRPEKRKWRAVKKQKHIGYFDTKEEAAIAFNNYKIAV